MAKRFIDTGLFNDSWFMNLSVNNKLFFIYLITNCDHAGIIDLNLRLAEFQTGIKDLANSYETIMEQFNGRLIRIRENYHFIPKFVKYQYPNGLNENVKAQLSVMNRLNEFSIDYESVMQQLGNSLITVQDIDIDKEKDIDKDKDKKSEKLKKFTINRKSQVVIDYLSDKSELFVIAFDEFWDMRNRIKKPIETERTFNKIVKDLVSNSNGMEDDMIKLLNQSTDHRWQGIFPLKDNKSEKSTLERKMESINQLYS